MIHAPKGFQSNILEQHLDLSVTLGLLDGDEEARIKAIGRALTGLENPDYDDILSAIMGIPKRLLQTCPLDGPVPQELLELNQTSQGTFENLRNQSENTDDRSPRQTDPLE